MARQKRTLSLLEQDPPGGSEGPPSQDRIFQKRSANIALAWTAALPSGYRLSRDHGATPYLYY